MKDFYSEIRSAVMATLVLALVCCGFYPLVVWGIAQVCFPTQANGSLLTDAKGQVIGSKLIGQDFTGAKYFHPRPSAAGIGYDAANSGGSNLGPTSRQLYDTIKGRVEAYRKENGLLDNAPVPADAVTTSASGLDPHISPRNAELQVSRVAKARGMNQEKLRALVKLHTEGPDLGFLGEPGVNVLTLNLALDSLPASGERVEP
jgi:potassium-transporting ATPase KdpC subunit